MVTVHYYTRRGCHLCEVMLEELLPLLRGRAKIETRDIDSNPVWHEKYNVRVPVLEFDGQWVSDYPLKVVAVESLLARIQ